MSKKDLFLELQDPFKDFANKNFCSHKFKQAVYKQSANLFIEQKEYQAVIMAAGKGSRMNIDYPKTLYEFKYPSGNRSILSNTLNLINMLPQNVSKVFVIVREEDLPFFNKMQKNTNVEFITLSENQIKGTANCLLSVKEFLNKDLDILMFWGDLVLIPKSDVELSIDIHNLLENSLTFPTRYKLNPYVAFLRNRKGKINEIAHKNEGKNFRGWAEQDCSLFIFRYSLFSELAEFIDTQKILQSKESNEIDFVHFIPFLSYANKRICPLPISNDDYIYDINTNDSAIYVQKKLSKMSKSEFKKIYLNNQI